MANKKRRKAKSKAISASNAEQQASIDADITSDDKASAQSKSSSESKGSSKEKDKSKGKDKDVVKSQARAKDPKKSGKKPNIFRRFIEYIKAVRIEIKRTTWPTKHEVLNLTIIVLVALIFFGVLIFVLDLIMVELLNLYGEFAPDAATVDASSVDASGADSGTGDTAGDGSADSGEAETDGGE